jgi:AbrB family looped-hinge helix DNA binding protein
MEIVHSKISTKGQAKLPKKFRDKLKILPGGDVEIILTEDGILIKPRLATMSMLRGILRGKVDLDKARDFIRSERKKWS